jgi:hypothetical protein
MMTLNEALAILTVDQLKQYLHFMPDEQGGSKKADLIRRIENGLAGDKLQAQYRQMDDIQQAAVAEALYATENRFRGQAFKAKYGKSPVFTYRKPNQVVFGAGSYDGIPDRILLFLYSDDAYSLTTLFVPIDLVARLKLFVPKPAAMVLSTVKELPTQMEDGEPVIIRLTEQEALQDLPVVLRLVEQGGIQVGEKTGHPALVSQRLLAEKLTNGDFYLIPARMSRFSTEVGALKAFAWPVLLQAAKLTQMNGKKMGLSKAGMSALSKPVTSTLRSLWQKWQKTSLLDEFNRVDEIKGQYAKGRVMTVLAPRREAVQAVLRQCPVGEWIGVDSLFNFMQATGLPFDVTYDPNKLYVGDASVRLGYNSFHDWPILQGRYVLCLLFEYVATLGMVDVAYIAPERARDDFRVIWGVKDMDFLSRYDGLLYFRLNALGGYCLGLTDNYQAPVIEGKFLPDAPAHEAVKPLKKVGTALVVECIDEASAAFLSSHTDTAKLCQRIASKHLLVKLEHEIRFTKAAQKLGFSLPQ